MNFRSLPYCLVAAASLLLGLLLGACSTASPARVISASGSANGSATAGSIVATSGVGASSGTSDQTATAGSGSAASGQEATSGVVSSSTGASGLSGASAGTSGASSTSGSGATTGESGTTGATGASGFVESDAGAACIDGGYADTDPPAPRPINVTPGGLFNGNFNGQPMRLDKSKPILGKLILLLGGICGGTGAGGIESFIDGYGFHMFSPATQTCVNTAPQMYKDIIAKTPLDPEANRQVGDARLSLWDGVNRVTWVTVSPNNAILNETIAAIKYAMTADVGGDWGYYLNADGTLRTSDVWVVGYSWGSQTWAMISSYVRFGRVITTSGPQAEGFPNATWITTPNKATPADRKYMAVGFVSDYPSTTPIDIAPNTVTSMIDTTTAAGWIGPPMNVHPGDTGPFTCSHQFPMVGSNGASPGGHTVFCTSQPGNGWIPICKYLFGVE
jgi:hypothetical protein